MVHDRSDGGRMITDDEREDSIHSSSFMDGFLRPIYELKLYLCVEAHGSINLVFQRENRHVLFLATNLAITQSFLKMIERHGNVYVAYL